MATLTAQILVGSGHTNHDGINPTHYIFLSENSRPAWLLTGQNIFDNQETVERITWIPAAPETILEDVLLMIAVHIVKDEDIVQAFNRIVQNSRADFVDLSELGGKADELDGKSDLPRLYEMCRKLDNFPKLIISVFESSSIAGQLTILQKYGMDVEVCTPQFSRIYSEWREETVVEGSLDY